MNFLKKTQKIQPETINYKNEYTLLLDKYNKLTTQNLFYNKNYALLLDKYNKLKDQLPNKLHIDNKDHIILIHKYNRLEHEFKKLTTQNLDIDFLNIEKDKILKNMNSMAYIFTKYSENINDCCFEYVSEASNSIYNLNYDQMTKMSQLSISKIKKEYVQSFIDSITHSYKTLEILNWEGLIKVEDSIKFINCHSKPYLIGYNGIHKIVKWYGCITDNTEAYTSKLEYEQLIETANAPIIGTDVNLNINVWNNKIAELSGYSKKEVLGKHIIQEYILEEEKENIKKILNNTLLKGKSTDSYKCKLKTKKGIILNILLNANPRRNLSNKITGILGVGQDITQLEKYYKNYKDEKIKVEIEKKFNQHKTEFLRYIFHEVRGWLQASILGTENLEHIITKIPIKLKSLIQKSNLKKDYPVLNKIITTREDSVKHKLELLKDITHANNNILQILNDTLNLNKIENSKFEYTYDFNNIEEIVKRCLSQIKHKCKKKNIKLESNIKCIEKMLYLDKIRITQSIVNFLSNAAKFTPNNGNIKINIFQEKRSENKIFNKIMVKDTGIGLNKEELKTLFKPFTQLRSGKSLDSGGSGLGLSLVKRFIEDGHNGKVYCESEQNVGSKFIIEFICKYKSQTEEKIESESESESESDKIEINKNGNKDILLIEDSKVNRKMVSMIFKRNKITFDLAEDGLIALEKIKNETYKLILCDKEMPKLDGYGFLKEYLKLNIKTPVIGLTGNALEQQIKEFKENGAVSVITKPFTKDKQSRIFKLFQ